MYSIHSLPPPLSLRVLQDLFIKPALLELLALVHQLEQLQIFIWIHVTCQDVFG